MYFHFSLRRNHCIPYPSSCNQRLSRSSSGDPELLLPGYIFLNRLAAKLSAAVPHVPLIQRLFFAMAVFPRFVLVRSPRDMASQQERCPQSAGFYVSGPETLQLRI